MQGLPFGLCSGARECMWESWWKRKKRNGTYKPIGEILSFVEGKSLDEIEKAREEGKRPYQKLLLAVAAGAITFAAAMVLGRIWGIFGR